MLTKSLLQLRTSVPSILIVESEQVICQGLTAWVGRIFPEAAVSVCLDFATMNRMLVKDSFNVLIYGLEMMESDSYATIKRLRATHSALKILVFSRQDAQLYESRYLKAGADAYLPTLCSYDRFRTTLQSLYHRRKLQSLRTGEATNGTTSLSGLSNRELEIARLLVQGHRRSEIASYLNIHNSSVGTYQARLFKKLGIARLAQLVALFNASVAEKKQPRIEAMSLLHGAAIATATR